MGANQSLGADVFARRLPRSLTFDGHPSNDNVKSGRAHRSHTFQHAEKRRSGGGRGDEEASVSLSDVDAEARDAVDSDEDELSAEELREYRWRLLEPPAAELETLHSYSVRPLSLFLVVCGGMPVPRHWCCTTLRAKGGACGRGVAEALRFAIMFLVGLVVFVRNLRVWVCPPHDLVESDRQEWLQAFVPGFALIAMMTVWFGMMRSGLWVHVLYAPYVLASALYDAHDRIGYTTPNAPLVLPPKKKSKSDDRSSESSAATLEMSQDLHAHRDDADSDDVVPRSVPAGRNANGSVPNEVDEEMRALSQRAMERMSMFNEAQNEYAHQLSRSVAGWSLFVAMLAATIFFLSRANAVRSLESADTPEDRLDARKSLFERTCDEDAYDAMGPALYLAHLFIWYYGAYMLSVTMFTASMYSYSGVQRMLIMVLKNFRAKVARSSGGTATSKTQSSLHHVKLLASWFSVKKVHALRALADMEGSLRRLATFTMIAAATVLSIGPVGTLVGFMFYDDDLTVLNFVSAVVVTLCVSIFLTLLFKVGREKTALANEMETVYVALGNAGAHISAGQMSEDVQRVHSIMPHMLDRSHSQLHIEAQQSDVHRHTVSSAAGVEPPTTTGQSLEELRARAPPRLDSRARVLSSGGFSVPMSLEEELLLEMEEEAGIDNVDDSSVKPMNWKVLSVVAEEVEQMRRASVVSRGDSSDEEAPLRGNTGRQAEEMEEEEEARRQRHAHELQRKRSAMDRVISHHHVERSMNVTAAPLGTLLYQYKRIIIGMLLLLVLGTVIMSLSGALVFPACAAYDFDALTVIKNSGVEWAALDSLSYSDCSSSLENIALLLHGLRASFTAHLPLLVLFLMVRRRFFTSSSRLVNFSLGSAFAVTTLLTILALFDKLTTTNRVSYALFVVNSIVVGKLWGDHYDSMSMQDKIDIRGPDFAVRVTLMEMAQSRFSTTEETQLVLRSAELRKIAAGVVIPSMASMTLGTHQGQGHVQADALQQTELPSTFTSGKVFMLVFWVQMLGLALLAAIVRSLEVPSFLLMDDDNGRMFVALLIHPLLGPTLLSVFTWAGFKLSETGHVFSENGVVPWVIAHCTLSLYSRFFVFTMSNLGVQVLTAVLFGLSKIINRTTRHVRRYFIWGAVKDAAFGRKKSETYRTHPYYAHTEMYAMIIEIASVVFAGSASLAIVSAYDESVDTSSSTVVASMILQLFVTMFADTIAVKVQIEFGGRTFLPIWKHFQRMYWFIVGCSFSAVLIIASLDLFLLSRRVQS